MSEEKKKFNCPEYKRMHEVLKVRLGEHLWKSVLMIFLFNVLVSFLLTAGLSPAMMLTGRLAYAGYALSAAFTFLMVAVIFSLSYGMISQFTDNALGRKKYGTRLFLAFSEPSDRVLKACVFFSSVATAIAVLSAAAMAFFKEPALAEFSRFLPAALGNEAPDEETVKALKALFLAFAYCIIFCVLFAFSFLPFIFVWNAFLEDKKIRFFGALKKSILIVKGRYFHYMGFVLFSCIKNILMLAAASALQFFISQQDGSTLGFVSVLLGFFAFMQYYTVLSKLYYCIPIYYYSFLSVNGLIDAARASVSESADGNSEKGCTDEHSS